MHSQTTIIRNNLNYIRIFLNKIIKIEMKIPNSTTVMDTKALKLTLSCTNREF